MHFIGFRQLVQKLERMILITFYSSTDKQNEWSFYGFSLNASKLERITPIISTLQDKQNERPFYGFSSTGSKVTTNNTNHFYSSKQTK